MSFNEHNIESGKTEFIKWSMAFLPKEGENECGDVHLVQKYDDKVMVAAIDGLGHGSSAAKASQRTIDILRSYKNESLIALINRCHKELRKTRGVVMSLALIDSVENTMTWIGVGNVEGFLLRASSKASQNLEHIVMRGGVIGYKLPSLQASMIPIYNDDVLIFTTDGVQHNYIDSINIEWDTKKMVDHIASNYFKRSDDALIIAGRYLGEGFQHED